MDDFEKDMKDLQLEFMPMVNQIQSQLIQSLEQNEKYCIDQSRNDVERFVECMLKKTKKIEKEEKRFQFKLSYMQNTTQNCFKLAAENGTSKDTCKSIAKDNVDRYLRELIQSIAQ